MPIPPFPNNTQEQQEIYNVLGINDFKELLSDLGSVKTIPPEKLNDLKITMKHFTTALSNIKK